MPAGEGISHPFNPLGLRSAPDRGSQKFTVLASRPDFFSTGNVRTGSSLSLALDSLHAPVRHNMAMSAALFVILALVVLALAVCAPHIRRCYARSMANLDGSIKALTKHDLRVAEVEAEERFRRQRDDARSGKVRGAGALGSSKVSPAKPTAAVSVSSLPADPAGSTCELDAGDLVQARTCKSVRGQDIYDKNGSHFTATVMRDNRDGTYAIQWEGGQMHPAVPRNQVIRLAHG